MTQEFLDNKQYTELSILRYEAIYGHNYISPGGENTTDQFIDTLKLLPKMRVLDIGCGLGGPALPYGQQIRGPCSRLRSLCKHDPHCQDPPEGRRIATSGDIGTGKLPGNTNGNDL